MSTRSSNHRIVRTPALVHAVIFVLVAMLGPAQAVHAAGPERRTYDIPSGALSQALVQFAAAAGVMLSADARLTDGKHSPRLRGEFSVEAGLASLLAGSRLPPVQNTDGSYTLRPTGDAMDALMREARRPLKLAEAAAAPAKTPEGDTGELPEMTVTASPLDATSYNVPNATTATKTDTPIMETPVNIQVVPQQVLRDQQVVRIEKALQNVSGVYSVPGGGRQDNFLLRGFQVDSFFVDGVRVSPGSDLAADRETANLERIEVLKGPASILYGRIDPGGLVNVVRKQPLAQPFYALEQQFGSFDFYRTTIDTTGPITQDDTLLYRLNLAYENAGSFREFLDNERVFLAPVLLWNLSPRTQARFYLEYLHSRAPSDSGLPALGNRPAPVPRERNLGEPGERVDFEEVRVGFNWSHAFNDHWTLRQHFDTAFSEETQFFLEPFPLAPLDPQNCTQAQCLIPRFIADGDGDVQNYFTSLDLTGRFDTWGIGHTLLLGGDYYRFDTTGGNRSNFAPHSFIDLFDPVHTGPVSAALLDDPDSQSAFDGSFADWYGFYVQDQVELPYDLHLLAGFRYDNAGVDFTGTDLIPRPPTTSTFSFGEDAVTPRFGLLWQPLPALSLYGNYVEGFGANNGFSRGHAPLPPETAQQWELGLKTELFDGRLTGTLAWFDLTKQNVAAPDPNPVLAAQGFSVATGEVRNQGLEFDVSGEIWPEVRLIGSYAYIESEITKDRQAIFNDDFTEVIGFSTGNQGNRLFGVCRATAREPLEHLRAARGPVAGTPARRRGGGTQSGPRRQRK